MMDKIEFSRQAAIIWNSIKDPEKHDEFQAAAIYAGQHGGDNPLKLMPKKFREMFKTN